MKAAMGLLCAGVVVGQLKPVVSQRNVNGQVNLVRLAPRYTTAIRMPETVSSVILGDPGKFLAEHSEKEPTLVLVKPAVEEPAQSNLLVTTVKGRQVSFVLRSEAGGDKAVNFVLSYEPAGSFLVEESGVGRATVPKTETLRNSASLHPEADATPDKARSEPRPLERLLERQKRAEMPKLYGRNPPTGQSKGDRIRAGVSEVLDEGRRVVVLFSVANPQEHAIEILPPQIQLAGTTRKGLLLRRDRRGTNEQIAVTDYLLSRRRLGPGERADGIVVFTRPGFKQANESLFLQIAESGAIDKPALAPIGFGVSTGEQGASNR